MQEQIEKTTLYVFLIKKQRASTLYVLLFLKLWIVLQQITLIRSRLWARLNVKPQLFFFHEPQILTKPNQTGP